MKKINSFPAKARTRALRNRRWGGWKVYQSHTLGFGLGCETDHKENRCWTFAHGGEDIFSLHLSHAIPWGVKEMRNIHHPALVPSDRRGMNRKAVVRCHEGKAPHQLCACWRGLAGRNQGNLCWKFVLIQPLFPFKCSSADQGGTSQNAQIAPNT